MPHGSVPREVADDWTRLRLPSGVYKKTHRGAFARCVGSFLKNSYGEITGIALVLGFCGFAVHRTHPFRFSQGTLPCCILSIAEKRDAVKQML